MLGRLWRAIKHPFGIVGLIIALWKPAYLVLDGLGNAQFVADHRQVLGDFLSSGWGTASSVVVGAFIVAFAVYRVSRQSNPATASAVAPAVPNAMVVSRSPPEALPANHEAWRGNDYLLVWQAACLWAGREPDYALAVSYGTRVYPYFSMLLRSIEYHQINVSRHEPEMAWSQLSRQDLIKLAVKKRERPQFLFMGDEVAQPTIPQTEMMALEEFAVSAFERTKDGIVGEIASSGNDESGTLRWYATFASLKVPIYGCRPPSRLIEVTDRTGHYFAFDIDRFVLKELSGNKKWTSLQIIKADAQRCYEMLDGFDPQGWIA